MKKRSREELTPDITPLIDVIFLLLIFFMVSTVFKKDEFSLLLNLPKTKNSKIKSQGKKKNLVIELSTKRLAINKELIKLNQLNSMLEKIKNKKIPIVFRVDKEVKYQKIMNILDKLQKYSLTNISLVSKK